MQRQAIEVALDHQRPRFVGHGAPCTVETKEGRSFPKNRGFRTVEVLGLAVAEDPTSESDERSVTGADREGEAVAEAIVRRRAAFGPHRQTALDQRTLGMAAGHVLNQPPPFVRRITKPVVAPLVFGKSTPLEFAPRRRSLCLLETFTEEVLGLLEQRALTLALLPTPPGLGTSRRELNAVAACQPLHRLREAEVLELHEELEDVAALVTSETVVETLLRVDRERRRFFFVERAQALPASTSFFQPNVVADNLNEVGRLANASDDVTVEVGIHHRGSFSHREREAELRIRN